MISPARNCNGWALFPERLVRRLGMPNGGDWLSERLLLGRNPDAQPELRRQSSIPATGTYRGGRLRLGYASAVVLFDGELRLRNICKAVVLALLSSVQAHGTSIVAKVEQQRIILAADTLEGVLTEKSGPQPTNPHNSCKIVVLGRVAFSAIGHPDYQPVTITDLVAKWDAYDDARNAYDLHPKDIRAMAEHWGKLASNHYASFYSHRKDRVISMAAGSYKNLLLRGVFAGWDKKGNPELVFMSITLNGSHIEHEPRFMSARSLPYSPNDLTKLMIESSVPKSKALRKEWASKSKDFPKEERDWRELEFLIQTTSEYEPNVGKDVVIV